LAAGDTFRAAAVDQLKTWGQRLEVPVIAQETGADSAAVVFDALNAAKARKADLLIADTAGRLHTQEHLMDELRKVKRVLQKIDPEAPHGVLLVLDAGNGQNALNQAKVFHEAMAVSGIALTKLDGTAKGGISFAICQTLKLPLWFIGVGEQADDLRPFVAEDFVDALLNQQK
jgi:fused signal recognition particle receptor